MVDKENKYEIRKFEDGGFSLDIRVSFDENTIWLSANEIALLLERDVKTIRKHINNIIESNDINIPNNTQKLRLVGVKQKVSLYSLDVITCICNRVKTKRVNIFNEWVTKTLKESKELNNQSLNQKSFYNANNYEIVRFENGSVSLDINVSPYEDTV